jgi:nitroimidazol reductase NimA-like FMN-containing flavoprotein (pyridoxamine 5'-phosphate oxidase superfamily)
MKPTKSKAPKASRPLLPKVYGVPEGMTGSVSWAWAQKRLTASHNYLITTVRPEGRPHAMVIWAIWLDNAYYFSTGEATRKAKNLATNPNCVVCNENIEEAVIVEGKARPIEPAEVPKAAFEHYLKKYGWKLDPQMGPIFKVTPRKAIAMPEKLFPKGATRWLFK